MGLSSLFCFFFFLVTQEVRDWQLMRPKLKPEQKIQMNLVDLVVLPYSKQKEKKKKLKDGKPRLGSGLTSGSLTRR